MLSVSKGLFRRWVLLLAIILGMLAVDQVTKRMVVAGMQLGDSRVPIPALEPVFRITYIANRGSAFGFLPQAGDLFLILALVIVGAMIVFYPRLPAEARVLRLAIGLVCGGALGNAFDRLSLGYVVDFIHYRVPGLIDNVSNLADHAIVFGVLLILVDNGRGESAPDNVPDAPAEQQPRTD